MYQNNSTKSSNSLLAQCYGYWQSTKKSTDWEYYMVHILFSLSWRKEASYTTFFITWASWLSNVASFPAKVITDDQTYTMTILVVNTVATCSTGTISVCQLCCFHTLSTLHDDAANDNCNDGSGNDYKQSYTNSHSCKNQDMYYTHFVHVIWYKCVCKQWRSHAGAHWGMYPSN